ncbi:fibronectin type III domain-containing protein [Acanthopleuribacter pedis]|uniref:Fibronectin type III domain-containing protein n=1 Tax=Acanthopleuribacter pedis TaxID=442870 RepID=A0A8J7Q2V1_9BACT|nr:fibronectin type III domain-containing protein [Acanthopleuribacter pedis]MBO1317529.1 fibronectin type III domain-containing protein [Acanthopleuribacter pedis]
MMSLLSATPRFVYLTYEGETGTSITVNFQTFDGGGESWVYLDTASRNGQVDAYTVKRKGKSHKVPGLEDGRDVHWVRLDGLTPNTTYYCVAGNPEHGFSKEIKFRTLPVDSETLRIVTGGDFGTSQLVGRMFRGAASHEPHLALLGGDIAYADGSLRNADRWDAWLKLWTENMITPSGYTVPMMLAIGNHEVSARYGGDPKEAPFFYNYFAQAGTQGYFRRQLGDHTVVYVLDSGHTNAHGGEQARWLEKHMAADRHQFKNLFAVYHVPLYPSHRVYETKYSVLGRQHWEPIFSRYGLTAAFENHDHTYKRSKPLSNGKIDKNGVLYIGDGAWGRGDRGIDLVQRWYLDKVGSMRHYWLVEVAPDNVVYRAFDKQGKVFDVFPDRGEETKKAHDFFQTVTQQISFDERPMESSAVFVANERFDGGRVELRLHNREKVEAQVTLTVEAPAVFEIEQTNFNFPLKPGRRRVLEIPLNVKSPIGIESTASPKVKYSMAFTVDGKTHVNQKEMVIGLEKRRLLKFKEIKLDGDLGEWGEMREPFRDLDKAALNKHKQGWGGPSDASCRFTMFHDRKNVFIAVKVRDDRVVVSPEVKPWRQDGILFWVDSFPGEGDDDPNFVIAPLGDKGLLAGIDNAPEGMDAITTTTKTGYQTEIKIPIAFFRERLQEEGGGGRLRSIRINFALIDLDRPDGELRHYIWRPAWEEAGDFAWSGVYVIE